MGLTERHWFENEDVSENYEWALEDAVKNAAPVVHGQWTEQTVHFEENSEDGLNTNEWQSTRCSVCKRYFTTPYMYYFTHYDYCPNCGAKMDAEPKPHENT